VTGRIPAVFVVIAAVRCAAVAMHVSKCRWYISGVAFGGGRGASSPSAPLLSFLSLLLSFLPPPLPGFFLSLLSVPLEVGPPEIQLGDLRERSELPLRGLGRSPSQNQILCVLVLKDEIWRRQL